MSAAWTEMEDLLARERDVVLAGRLEALPDLTARKTALLEVLNASGLRDRPPENLVLMASNNSRLLEAAGRGLRTAIDRIEGARTGGETTTYDMHGRVRTLSAPTAKRGTRA